MNFADLPFLKKKKGPRIAQEPSKKLVGHQMDSKLEDQCIDELWASAKKKDSKAFRKSLEALVLNIAQGED